MSVVASKNFLQLNEKRSDVVISGSSEITQITGDNLRPFFSVLSDGAKILGVTLASTLKFDQQTLNRFYLLKPVAKLKYLYCSFKALNGLDISDIIMISPYPSGSALLQTFPRSRLNHKSDRAFSVAAPRLWNTLPFRARPAEKLKFCLKTHIFFLAYVCI